MSKTELTNELICLSQRHKYMLYDRSWEKIDIIMKLLDDSNYTYGDVSYISTISGVPTSTLSYWRKRQKEDINYHPLLKATSQCKRIFTDEEESYITDYIEENIIKQGLLFQNQDFKNLIMEAYLEKYYYEDDYSKLPKFNASDGFVTDFKRRNDFVSRRLHCARRPLNTAYDEEFSKQMEYLFTNIDKSYIINIDETSWEVIPKILKSWHKKGEDHVIRYINGNIKDRITVVAGIRADGLRLPLQFIATGKTDYVCTSQIGDVDYHFKTYSENGWTTINTFKDYIVGIRDFYGYGKETLHIICDSYKVHISDEILDFAEMNNIKLYFIPSGFTDQLQPLDVGIFGPLKSIARKLFMDRFRFDPFAKRTKIDACQDLVCAWNRIGIDQVRESFENLQMLY